MTAQGVSVCVVSLLLAFFPNGVRAQPPAGGVAGPNAPASADAPRTTPSSPPLAPSTATHEEPRPWRAHQALDVSWLHFGLDHRSRFEHLANDFRTSNPGNATGYFMRTSLSAELCFSPFFIGAELEDARAWTSDTTPLNTTLVNPLELLRGYVSLRGESVLVDGDAASLTAGRITIDLGSRRLVARNEFRNTINGFTGVDAQWTSPGRDVLRAFAAMPVVRFPSDASGLRANRVEFDRENTDALVWAAFFRSRPFAAQVSVEAYVVGLHERDSDLFSSANRQLVTPGLRVLRPPAPGRFDFQLELIGQFGRSRASAASTDMVDLDHLALLVHVSAGYRFGVSWAPRVALHYDCASGDGSPDDGANNRFDVLFGARRFDLGPTGTWGAIARSNVNSPGLRLEAQPHRALDAFAAYRLAWLASARDAWTTAGLRDSTGASGSFVGHQVEGRVRWLVLPGNLSLDVGGAILIPGEFAVHASGGDATPSAYVYSQVTGTI